ncbi:hypothetical protein EXE10_18540 [Acinetobacter sp. WCHAc060033]|uniref:hypothetical protein n=1 Tax=Acinetobacter sp. WCHAc060033 TaxID=2518624 RepID=UPI00102307CA|nr:hypothetical protein [Acinetobacter sp. WCHAc060033]RZG77975.1 hypothetical protein EXE10_18540 [Acinetobacter sp. WCHAc060033]
MKFILIFVLILSGCSNIQNGIFLTKELPTAKLNQKYYFEIKMKEQGIIQDKFYVETNINKESGLVVVPNQGVNFMHSSTIIEGTPKNVGEYNIHISGVARSGLKKFDKTFILIVNE